MITSFSSLKDKYFFLDFIIQSSLSIKIGVTKKERSYTGAGSRQTRTAFPHPCQTPSRSLSQTGRASDDRTWSSLVQCSNTWTVCSRPSKVTTIERLDLRLTGMVPHKIAPHPTTSLQTNRRKISSTASLFHSKNPRQRKRT